MNKKFLSAILFGALMVTSTGTFVSCKDYDDDIDRLDQEISNVKDAIKALEDKVGSGKYVESCTPFTDGNGGYEIKFSDGETIKLYNGAKGEQGEPGKPGTPGTPGTSAAAAKTSSSDMTESSSQGKKVDGSFRKCLCLNRTVETILLRPLKITCHKALR